MDAARRAAVATMLGARSLAVVGASPRPDSFGSRMILEARRGSARVHLVNPRYDRIGELPCAPSLTDLDEAVDLVLLGVPDAALLGQLEAAAATGARSAVLFGSAHGLRDEITATATAAGMALCGAGCMGFVNNALGVRALGYLEPDPLPPGGICLVTHSGSAFSTLLRARRGFGFRLAVSSGQELVTDTADYVEYALGRSRDPDHRAVDGDTPLRPTAAAGAATRRGARCAGGHPVGRRFAAGPRDGRGAFGCAGRRGRGLAGVLRGHRGGTRARLGRNDRHPRIVRRGTAGFRWRTRHWHRARFRRRARAGRRPRPRAGCGIRRSGGPTRWPRSASCSTTACRPPTRWTCGVRAPTPARCSAPACGRSRKTRR